VDLAEIRDIFLYSKLSFVLLWNNW